MFAYEPALRVAVSDDPAFPDEAEAAEHSTDRPLEIEEWQTCYARFYDNIIPTAIEHARYAVRVIQPGLLELNFRNFVGLSTIGNLHLNICNKKISTELYQAMLDELAEQYAGLVFSFGTPVAQHYDKTESGRDSLFIEYLFLCRYLLRQSPDLDTLGTIIGFDPHRKFESEMQPCPVEECQAAGNQLLFSMVTSPMAMVSSGSHLSTTRFASLLQAKTGRDLYPSRAIKERKFLTVDTPENRFVKFFLESLAAKVEKLQKALSGQSGSYFNPDIGNNLAALRNTISRFLSHNIWREVEVMKFIPVASQVLQRRDGYRQLFSLYSLLQLASHCDFLETDFQNLIEIKDVPTLYEYWCFFQIKRIMDSLSGMRAVGRIINETSLETTLSEGLCIEYECGVKLFFNKTYQGSSGLTEAVLRGSYKAATSYSHTFRPDIVLEFKGQKLIFDAKYKGKNSQSGFYGKDLEGTITTWKDEDVDKMHCYHDAIRHVVGSFILYPGRQDVLYPGHRSDTFFQGVGALALWPGKASKALLAGQGNIRKIITAFAEPTGSTDS